MFLKMCILFAMIFLHIVMYFFFKKYSPVSKQITYMKKHQLEKLMDGLSYHLAVITDAFIWSFTVTLLPAIYLNIVPIRNIDILTEKAVCVIFLIAFCGDFIWFCITNGDRYSSKEYPLHDPIRDVYIVIATWWLLLVILP